VHVLIVAQKASNQELWVETISDAYPEIDNVLAVFSEKIQSALHEARSPERIIVSQPKLAITVHENNGLTHRRHNKSILRSGH